MYKDFSTHLLHESQYKELMKLIFLPNLMKKNKIFERNFNMQYIHLLIIYTFYLKTLIKILYNKFKKNCFC